MARKTEQLSVGRRRITVSNLDKILYPGGKFTKARKSHRPLTLFGGVIGDEG